MPTIRQQGLLRQFGFVGSTSSRWLADNVMVLFFSTGLLGGNAGFHDWMPSFLRIQTRPQQIYLARNLLRGSFAILIQSVAGEIEEPIAVTINRAPVVALERCALGQLNPVRDPTRHNEFANGAG